MLTAQMSVSGPESYILSARLGLGLVQMPNFHAVDDLARGTLVRVLLEFPPPAVPVSLLYPPNRQLSPRVRIFINTDRGPRPHYCGQSPARHSFVESGRAIGDLMLGFEKDRHKLRFA